VLEAGLADCSQTHPNPMVQGSGFRLDPMVQGSGFTLIQVQAQAAPTGLDACLGFKDYV